MYHYTAYGLKFSSGIEIAECLPSAPGPPDFSVERAAFPVPAELTPVPVRRRGVQAYCAVEGDSYYMHWEGIATFRAVGGQRLEVRAYTEDPKVLSLFIVCEALGMILFQRQYFLLHASAVRVGHEAWVFIASPGTGKSTTSAAFVKAGCALLSDDLTAVTFDEAGTAYVQPGYPQLKIWEQSAAGLGYRPESLQPVAEGIRKYALHPVAGFPGRPVKLGRIYFLDQAEDLPALEQLSPGFFPVESLKHFSLSGFFIKGESQVRLFRQSVLCAGSAAVYRMRRPDGFEALEKWVNSCLEGVISAGKPAPDIA